MRICVPVDEKGGEYEVAEHFGRAAKYVMADTDGVDGPEWFIPDAQTEHAKCRGTQVLRKIDAELVACRHIGERASALLGKRDIGIVRTPSSRLGVTLWLASNDKLEEHAGCSGDHSCTNRDDLTQIGGHQQRERRRHRGQ